MEQRSGQSEVPPGRWNIDSYYHPNSEKGGSMNMRGGYFINEDLRQFENDFFGINNLEATYMDPEQRKLLEVVYECLENAGVPLEKASGANIGTYVGNFTIDMLMMQARDPEYMHRYNATGMGTTILANRISHALNLKGPRYIFINRYVSSTWAHWLTLKTVSFSIPLVRHHCTDCTLRALRWRRVNAMLPSSLLPTWSSLPNSKSRQ